MDGFSRAKVKCVVRGCICCFLVVVLVYGVKIASRKNAYNNIGGNCISAYRYSYYQNDSKGNRIISPGYVEEKVALRSENTAVIIMDPWKETSSMRINTDAYRNIGDVVIPLLDSFVNNSVHEIYFFTNSPRSGDKTTIKIDDRLMQYVENKQAKICYHQDYYSPHIFANELKRDGIKNIIYLGYHLNMCVIFRDVGVIPLYFHSRDLNFYVVPEGTLAVINDVEKDNLSTREAMSLMLAQNNIAKIIHAEDLLNFNW